METGVEDSEGSPMVDLSSVEGKIGGGEERTERVFMTAENQDANEREEMVSTRMVVDYVF